MRTIALEFHSTLLLSLSLYIYDIHAARGRQRLPAWLSISLSIGRSVDLSVYLSIYLSISLSLSLSLYLSVCQSVREDMHLSLSLRTGRSTQAAITQVPDVSAVTTASPAAYTKPRPGPIRSDQQQQKAHASLSLFGLIAGALACLFPAKR